MNYNLLTVEVRAEQHVVLARQRVRVIAGLLGLDVREQTYLATAVSELVRNALQYGGGGAASFALEPSPPCLRVTIRDAGTGIPELPAVLEGRYRSRTGMGIGISGSRRLVDQFEIESSAQLGTTIRLGMRLPSSLIVTPELVDSITVELARSAASEPLAEIQQQNQELLAALSELENRQREVEELNAALKLANLELIAQRAALQDADRAKTEFLAVLAHELRNPLGALSNALYLADNAEEQCSAAQHRSVVKRQTAQLSRLVEDLLDVSRITKGKIELRRGPVALAQVLADAEESCRGGIVAREQWFESIIPEPSIMLDADAARLVQVFTNLLNNASKFTPSHGRIWLNVSLRSEGGNYVEVSVRDSGPGIPTELLSQVFDLFTQVPQTLARSQGGLGIGLTLVRSLVEMHGGTVRALCSGPGLGTEIIVTLPVITQTLPLGTSPENEPRRDPTKTLRVLLVDDHVDAANTLGEILESWGHFVYIAHDGLEALSIAETLLPNWVVCDIGLPGINGYEVAASLRTNPVTSWIRLVALTGYGGTSDLSAALKAGFEAHLTKPVNPNALKDLLEQG